MESQQHKQHTTERAKGEIHKEKLKFLETNDNKNTSFLILKVHTIR